MHSAVAQAALPWMDSRYAKMTRRHHSFCCQKFFRTCDLYFMLFSGLMTLHCQENGLQSIIVCIFYHESVFVVCIWPALKHGGHTAEVGLPDAAYASLGSMVFHTSSGQVEVQTFSCPTKTNGQENWVRAFAVRQGQYLLKVLQMVHVQLPTKKILFLPLTYFFIGMWSENNFLMHDRWC